MQEFCTTQLVVIWVWNFPGRMCPLFFPINWIPKWNPPDFQYDDSPPTYKEVTSCVKKARSSASASPIDQLSVLILKKCPMARTILHRILVECWTQKKIPKCWKNSATILIFNREWQSSSNRKNLCEICLTYRNWKCWNAIGCFIERILTCWPKFRC